MKGVKRVWVFVFVLMLILLSFISFIVSAVSNDFTATASAGFKACSCSAVWGNIKIKNTGDFINNFFVVQTGSIAEFSSVAPDKFVLAPGEEITIYEYIRLPCDLEGKYSLLTEIKTDLNLNKQFVQEIEAVKCANIELKPIVTLTEACRCTPLNYKVEVKNPATFSEKYSFSLDRFENYYAIMPNSTELSSGESRNISFSLQLPCNYGSQNLNFVARAEKSSLKAELPISAIINSSCYNLKFNATINATLYKPSGRNLLVFPLIAFFIVLFIIIILAVLVLTKKAEKLEKKPKKIKLEPYWWEELFIKKEREKLKESVYREFFRKKKDNKILKIIILIVAVVVLLSFTANYLLPTLGNFTLNATNKTELPFAPITTTTFKPEPVNETPISELKFALPYASYIVAGVVILLAILFVMRLRKEERMPYYEKVYEKVFDERFRKRLFIIILILAVLAVILLAIFYGKAIIAGKNETNITVSAIQNIAPEQNKTQELNKTALPEIFFRESVASVKSYIPYIIAGIVILAVIIFILRRMEKKE